MLERSTLEFLKELQKNNDREWFSANKARYVKANDNVIALAGEIASRVARFDPAIEGFDPRSGVFRIYRDVRFSKDKSPYKTNLGAFIAPGGRKSSAPGYYFHIEPKGLFCAAGKHMPDAAELLRLRTAVASRTKDFLKIVEGKKFRERFGEMHGERLSRPPKGFAGDHPAIEYIKLKSFTVAEELTEAAALGKDYTRLVSESFKAAYPLVQFLREALAT